VVLASVLILGLGAGTLFFLAKRSEKAEAAQGNYQKPLLDACVLGDGQITSYVPQAQREVQNPADNTASCTWRVPWRSDAFDRRPKPSLQIELRTVAPDDSRSAEAAAQEMMRKEAESPTAFKGFTPHVEKVPDLGQEAFILSDPRGVIGETTPIYEHKLYTRKSNLVMIVSYDVELSLPSEAQQVANSARERTVLLTLGKMAQDRLPGAS
jgi:hypothetical protein